MLQALSELIEDLIEVIASLFKPKLKLIPDIGKLLVCQQYEQTYAYIKAADKKCLKKELNLIIKRALKEDLHKTYKFKCDLYEFVFGEKSKYFNQKWYDTSDTVNDDIIEKLNQIKANN